MVLEATADIAQGNQVLVGYGPQYWVRQLYPDRAAEYTRLRAAGSTPMFEKTLAQIDPRNRAWAYIAQVQRRTRHTVAETARRRAVYQAARDAVPDKVKEVAKAFVRQAQSNPKAAGDVPADIAAGRKVSVRVAYFDSTGDDSEYWRFAFCDKHDNLHFVECKRADDTRRHVKDDDGVEVHCTKFTTVVPVWDTSSPDQTLLVPDTAYRTIRDYDPQETYTEKHCV